MPRPNPGPRNLTRSRSVSKNTPSSPAKRVAGSHKELLVLLNAAKEGRLAGLFITLPLQGVGWEKLGALLSLVHNSFSPGSCGPRQGVRSGSLWPASAHSGLLVYLWCFIRVCAPQR